MSVTGIGVSAWAAMVCGFLLASCGGGNPGNTTAPSKQTLALLIDTPNSSAPTQEALDQAFQLSLGAGMKGITINYTWSQLEPTPGQFDLASLQRELAANQDRGLQIYLGIQVINTVKREVPADLQDMPFDDPRFLARFHSLIDALGSALSGAEKYLSIGNEVDTYLSANPSQWLTYQVFYEDAVTYVHRQQPTLMVGVTTGFDAYSSTSVDAVRALNATSDFIALTYYPMQGGAQVRSPTAPLTDFPRMVSLADGRPVVMQEVGFPSGSLNGSSEQSEAEFVEQTFKAWRAQGDAMPFLSYFLLYDFDAPTCDALDAYYGVDDPAFTSFLCTLGLRRSDGAEKPAWSAFVAGAR